MRPGALIDERFVIDREAGAGGMGTVYLAFDRVMGEPVALKVLRGQGTVDAERMAQEAAILAGLDHPGIVRYVAHGVTGSGEHWLALEWLEGEDLAQRLARERLRVPECLAVAGRAASALAHAHARGMVHRDLKPSNLFLPGGGVASLKVLDFGIARVTGSARRLTCTGMVLGTLGYAAPEQIQDLHDADPRADVFALGCVLFECLTGRPAFSGAHPMAVLAKILLEGPPPLSVHRPGLPDALEALVEGMLAKDPRRRPADGAAVLRALADMGPIEEPASTPPPLRSALPSRPSLPPTPSSPRSTASFGREERRLVTVVLGGMLDPGQGEEPAPASELERAVVPFGARIALCAGRSLMVTIWSNGDATDRAERAARCALAIHARAPSLPLCIVTGRGQVAARLVSGDVIDRGVAALGETPPGAVHLDEATAGALGPRFLVERGGAERRLAGVHPAGEGEPLLLGRPAPCVGRDREIGAVEGAYHGCVGERMAGVALLIGPSGVGKSRLLRELVDRLKRRPPAPEVLVGRGDALAAGSPLGILADAVRRAAGLCDGEPVEERRRKLDARVQRWLPGSAAGRVAAFLGELAGAPFPDDAHPALRAARRDPLLMGDSMRAAWQDWLAAECAAGPVLLVLEDLHRGDAATVHLIDATLRNLRELPFMVVSTARPEVVDRFPDLWAERDLQTVRLGPLSRRAAEALVRHALGEGAGDVVVARLVEQGGGNPFYLQELVRAVAAGRGEALPASVLDAVEARLDAEGMDAKRALRAASIFGARFTREGLAALTGAATSLCDVWLARLAEHELVALASGPARPGDADYVFRDALVREAAYATLTDDDRALGHLLAGEWLEQRGHTDAVAMAEHFLRGGQPWRSVPWYLRAAQQALGANELAAAIDRADAGVACGADPGGGATPSELGHLRLVQAEAHVWRGELAAAVTRGAEASSRIASGSEAWFRAVTQVGLAVGRLGDLDGAEAWLETAVTGAPEPGAEGARIACLCLCVSQVLFGGRYAAADRALAAIDWAAACAGGLDAETRGMVHQARSFQASVGGDLGGAQVGLSAALTAFEEAGDLRNACATLSNLGHVHTELGDLRRAEEVLRAALAAAERLSLTDLTTVAECNLGPVLAQLGHLDEARCVEQRALEGFRRQGDRRFLGIAQVYEAKIALVAGDLHAAERSSRAAVETLGAGSPFRLVASAVLAQTLLRLGRAAEAVAASGEAHTALGALVEVEEGESLVRLAHAEALLAVGAGRELAETLTTARERLLARAARIRDPEWRRRFLADVPDNARILALAEGWCESPRSSGEPLVRVE